MSVLMPWLITSCYSWCSALHKSLALEGGRNDIYIRYKIYFFSAALTKQILFGVRTGSWARGDKKAQNASSVGLHAVSHFIPQRLQNVIKKTKRACQLLKF